MKREFIMMELELRMKSHRKIKKIISTAKLRKYILNLYYLFRRTLCYFPLHIFMMLLERPVTCLRNATTKIVPQSNIRGYVKVTGKICLDD